MRKLFMPIPTTGQISFLDLQNEFGGSYPISFSEYYKGGAYTTNNNTSVPTSGIIRISNFKGTKWYMPGSTTFTTTGTIQWQVPKGVYSIDVITIGGGGGGSGGGGDRNDGGVGGYAGKYITTTVPVTALTTISIIVGTGGAGGKGIYSGSNGMNPVAYGQPGTPSYISINGVAYAYAVGGATQTADAPGNGNWIPPAENSYYTTLTGVTTAGSANPYGNGGNGIFGGGGGGGGAPHTGFNGYGNGGNGGGGFVKITW